MHFRARNHRDRPIPLLVLCIASDEKACTHLNSRDVDSGAEKEEGREENMIESHCACQMLLAT